MTVKTIEQTIAQIKEEIVADIRWGRVPVTVQHFSDLHDTVDANCYGGFCDDKYADEMIAHYGGRDVHEGMPDGMFNHINAAFDAITVWLSEGGHHEALRGTYEHKESGSLYDLTGIDGDRVVICQQGGGFVMKPPAEQFFKDCKLQTQRPTIRAFLTGLDCFESSFTGWSSGYRWNGWAVPLFEKVQLLEILDLFEASRPLGGTSYTRFSEERDVVEWYDEGEEQWIAGAPEVLAVDLGDGISAEKKLYPLGDGWCWNFYGWWEDLK